MGRPISTPKEYYVSTFYRNPNGRIVTNLYGPYVRSTADYHRRAIIKETMDELKILGKNEILHVVVQRAVVENK